MIVVVVVMRVVGVMMEESEGVARCLSCIKRAGGMCV